MSFEVFNQQIPKLYTSLREMATNIAYIRSELPKLQMPDEIRHDILQMCDDFESALYDVRKEVRNLEDKLGIHPGEEPFDPDIRNPDPRVTMRFINNWLWSEIDKLHDIVTQLKRDYKDAAEIGIVYVLITESAANILRAFILVKDALNVITTALNEQQSA